MCHANQPLVPDALGSARDTCTPKKKRAHEVHAPCTVANHIPLPHPRTVTLHTRHMHAPWI